MRPLTARDLPWIMRRLGVPAHIHHELAAGLGDLSDPQGVPDYDEEVIWAGRLAQVQTVPGTTPVPTVDSVNNTLNIQQSPADAPSFQDINWNCINYSGANQINLTGNRARCVLIVMNLTATAIAVSFGSMASVVNNQGILLTSKGSNLYADRYCPTNNIYIDPNGSTLSVVQAVRAGPVPAPWVVSSNPGGP